MDKIRIRALRKKIYIFYRLTKMLFYHHLFVFLCNCYHWAIAIGMTSQYRGMHIAYKLSGNNSKLYNFCKQHSIYFTPEDIASGNSNPSF